MTENTGVIMLAVLADPEAVGIYRAATRYAQLVPFALLAAMLPLRPAISAAFARDDRTGQRRAARTAAALAMAMGLPAAALLIAFGDVLLAVFGGDFSRGRTALTILVLGQIANVAAGHVGVLMTMTGHEKRVAATVGRRGRLQRPAQSYLDSALWNRGCGGGDGDQPRSLERRHALLGDQASSNQPDHIRLQPWRVGAWQCTHLRSAKALKSRGRGSERVPAVRAGRKDRMTACSARTGRPGYGAVSAPSRHQEAGSPHSTSAISHRQSPRTNNGSAA